MVVLCVALSMQLAAQQLAAPQLLRRQRQPDVEQSGDFRPGRTGLPEEASGSYALNPDGNEVIEIILNGGDRDARLQGYLTRTGDGPSDRGASLTFFFARTTVSPTQITFVTKQVHGVWWSFAGAIERGSAQMSTQKGYYFLNGTLTEHFDTGQSQVQRVSLPLLPEGRSSQWVEPYRAMRAWSVMFEDESRAARVTESRVQTNGTHRERTMPIPIEGATTLLQVYDMPTSLRFYRDQLGFQVVSTSPALGGADCFDWVWLRLGGADIMLNTAYEFDAERPVPPDPARLAAHDDICIYLGCANLDAAYEELCGRGVAVHEPKAAAYGMRQMYLHDPDGYNLCFQCPA